MAPPRSDEWIERLRALGFRGHALAQAPLRDWTTWRIGGPAELLLTPRDVEDLERALDWTLATAIPWRILGNGSNLLVRERGVPGVVLRLRKTLDALRIEGNGLTAGAGASFPAVARRAAAAGLGGLEFGAGIPGTIGGAIVMNAGWHEHEIGATVESVELLVPGTGRRRLERDACDFGYRRSAFRGTSAVVLAARLRLAPGDPAGIAARSESFVASRKAHQPTELPSCGSVFLKPQGDFAGRLIEAAGLKGARVGDAQISPKHANFIVNLGRAASGDVLSLVERAEQAVEREFGVRLEREFELW